MGNVFLELGQIAQFPAKAQNSTRYIRIQNEGIMYEDACIFPLLISFLMPPKAL